MMERFIEKLQRIKNRIYADFLLPSRLDEYQSLLEHGIRNGYRFYSIPAYWKMIKSRSTDKVGRAIILRHDIDTDPRTARRLWEVEDRLRVQSSYYFRLSTLDIPLMKEIHGKGSEASYHYEELSTFAKKNGLRSKEEIELYLPEIRRDFESNLRRLRRQTGLPLDVVAAHGDWHNRKTKMGNVTVLQDLHLRGRLGIELEVYDEHFMSHVDSRHSDTDYPIFWKPSNPAEAISRGKDVIYLLIHPRQWQSNIPVNAQDDLLRAWEGLAFSVKSFRLRSPPFR